MQPGLGKNYFELFELPVQFGIDIADLHARYRKLQQQFHPDRFASASGQERRMSMEMTASINEGLRILKDPVSRGRYMLELAGVAMNEETDTAMNPAFLMEQMDLREQLEEAEGLTALLNVSREVDQAFVRRVGQLAHDLAGGDLQQARSLVRELQFLQKLKHQIEEKEESLA